MSIKVYRLNNYKKYKNNNSTKIILRSYMEQSKAMILSEKSKGQNNVYNFYVRQGDESENMIDLFGKIYKELIKICIE